MSERKMVPPDKNAGKWKCPRGSFNSQKDDFYKSTAEDYLDDGAIPEGLNRFQRRSLLKLMRRGKPRL